MKSRKIFIGFITSIIGIVFIFCFYQINHDETVNDAGFVKSNTQPVTQNLKTAYQFNSVEEYEKVSIYGKLPSHLRDANIFFRLSDSNGNLLIISNILNLFEYFFMALGEESIETVTGRIKEYIQLSLQGKAANDALAIFENFLDYRGSLAELRASYKLKADKVAIFAELKILRRKYFQPEVVIAFFAKEEAEIEYSLQSTKVNTNDSLNEEQKDKMLTELEEQLSEERRELIQREREEKKLEKQIKELQAHGGKEDEIYKLRKNFYGEMIAKQVTFMYDYSDEWNSRVDEYTQAKEEIIANPDLTAEEKKELINAAQNDSFTKKERLKLAYYELKKQLPH